MENQSMENNNVEAERVTKNNKPVKSKKFPIVAACIVGALVLFYVGFGVFFNSHFYFRSTVNGVKASAASPEKVAERLNQAADGYSFAMVDGDKNLLEIKPSDVDLTVNATAESVSKILDTQNGFLWLKYFFEPMNYEEERVVSLDDEKLQKIASDYVESANRKATKNTEDATFAFKGSAFVIVDEIYGNDYDEHQLFEALKTGVLTMTPSMDVNADQLYKQPEVTKDSKELQQSIEALNKKAGMEIVYDLGEEKETLEAKTIASWLILDEDMNVSYDTEAMTEYISEMASKYNTAGKPKTLFSSYNSVVTVPGGTYGWKIDKEGELEQLKSDIDAGKSVTRDFVYSQTAAKHGDSAFDYGDSYVEVNLTAQHLNLYVKGERVLDTDFVSGCIQNNTITHTGSYFIAYKQKDATLRGANYTSFVNYWMPFHNGEGLHDATWRNRFGGDIYLTNGSHGCVNLPKSKAASIYDYVSAGFPVLVYYLPGTDASTQYRNAAQPIVDAINAIGNVTLDSKPAIDAARVAYDTAEEGVRSYVTNYETLTNAEAAYAAQVQAASQPAADPAVQNPFGI